MENETGVTTRNVYSPATHAGSDIAAKSAPKQSFMVYYEW